MGDDMRRLVRLTSALLPLLALTVLATPATATPTTTTTRTATTTTATAATAAATTAQPTTAKATACEAVRLPAIPGARVLSVSGVARPDGYTIPPGPFNPDPIPGMPAFCELTVTLTHPGAHDRVTVAVWLPSNTWNGRFQGTGGGGFAAGLFAVGLVPALVQGYAAAATDAGVPVDIADPSSWADDPQLVTNFAYRSLHDMTVVGKAATARFYGRPPAYSYWNGCSTGGRQGLMEAQRYPSDYNGIVASAPAINWTRFIPAELWPQVVMNEAHHHPTQCVLEAFNTAAVAACDRLDKVADGVIGSPGQCHYDPRRLVGTTIQCDGRAVTITEADAAVVARIWAGPGVWSGMEKGTPFYGIANTTEDGTAGIPFPIADNWIKYFVLRDPGYDTSTLTYAGWYRLFARSQAEYARIFDTSDPNLTAFRAAGGKMVTWHGLADELIFPAGTTDYYRRVAAATPGRADDFYRVFLAPGVNHCAGGAGPVPTDPLAAVVAWVEHGTAPETPPAQSATATRNLCRYPLVSRYDGTGDPNRAASYRCARSY
jgi:hypothetical protein